MNWMYYNIAIADTINNVNNFRNHNKFEIVIPKNNDFRYNNIRGDLAMNYSNIIKKGFDYFEDSNGNIIKLNSKILFTIEIDENGFYYSNDKYNIYTFGETQKEAENNLYECFLVQFESYALEEDEKLDDKALLLKKDLLAIYGDYNA
ncbi:MAG: hypothetical protein IJV15_00175 [Lachnospiraceae bacterium]|nr:hypothetical protein [Lachnospiraceae bacterium]